MEFLDQLLFYPLDQLPFYLIALMIAFTVHEFAHAYAAYKFGDPTAKMLGRVTLNPAVHFDFLGIFLLLIAGFGWARPVPVNRDNFSRPRRMSVIVSAVGPLSNLALGIVGALIYAALYQFGVIDAVGTNRVDQAVHIFFNTFILLNFFLCLFNLIPLPPLDGYRILSEVLPPRVSARLRVIEQWSILIFLMIIIVPAFQAHTIRPLYNAAHMLSIEFLNLFILLFGG
ncbi:MULTISPECIES: site-2 protease family protein [Paenibacillus]|uniref:Site-2 protease family protein n=1 Tax=Paenibacillus campinasensis TaxID=66347 RepID=A0A268F4L5_9BACL|nr:MULTISPECIES: site-2 protease family protein [Paenibacillus]MUG64585.1 site-2 protease family protein [Paenibacillus campinasensis]PAD80311.1 site-2 protease family protein [Paenibacillus campinasensis]PAK55294.1 site-2 protease family protein [Paenibacillus sp. 7541]